MLFMGCGDDGGGGEDSPTITTHPSNDTVIEGQTATFTVAATGSGTLTYQWKKNGGNVVGGAGGTTASYTTPATTPVDDGAQFNCVVTNTGGSTESNPATLTVLAVNDPPSFTKGADENVLEDVGSQT